MKSFKDYCTEENYQQYIDLDLYDDIDRLVQIYNEGTKLINIGEEEFEFMGKGNLIAYYNGLPENYKKIYTNDEPEHKLIFCVRCTKDTSMNQVEAMYKLLEIPENIDVTLSTELDLDIEEPTMLALFYE